MFKKFITVDEAIQEIAEFLAQANGYDVETIYNQVASNNIVAKYEGDSLISITE